MNSTLNINNMKKSEIKKRSCYERLKTKPLQLRKSPNNATSTSYTTKTIRLQFRTLPKGYEFNFEHQQKLNHYNFVNYQTIPLQLRTLQKPYDFNLVHYQKDTISILYTNKIIRLQFRTPAKLYDFNFVHYQKDTTSI